MKQLTIEQFWNNFKALDYRTDKKLDYIYNVIDDAMVNNDWEFVNQLLATVYQNIYPSNNDLLIGFLSITNNAPKDKIPNRKKLYEQTYKDTLYKSIDEAMELMKGLE